MPENYQPPKFLQFDGMGNPKQHVAHFVETCSSAGTDGDLFVKQFVRSLKDYAFDCPSNSIDTAKKEVALLHLLAYAIMPLTSYMMAEGRSLALACFCMNHPASCVIVERRAVPLPSLAFAWTIQILA
ncbi:hypothetical protein Vadar_019555 [Vaccinium darrowii]|uniref:Uncharacterized protein n=1 Tax=Vaccinium darrowii TaxID=229202 RepID=A0ACB7Z7F5_9ERIC|nr:hypothetical protein Vadar_019555 [Vaccinium darrowii]